MSHSRVESKTAVKNSIGRLAFCALAILLEVVFIAMMFTKLNRYAPWIQTCTYILSGRCWFSPFMHSTRHPV